MNNMDHQLGQPTTCLVGRNKLLVYDFGCEGGRWGNKHTKTYSV